MNAQTIVRRALALLLALSCLSAGAARANDGWWNKDWSARAKVALDTSATGLETKSALANVPVVIRLDTSKFDFTKAEPGGLDLRVVAGDDKTPLKYFIEQYDDVNELATIWVQLPRLDPGANNGAVWLYYGNPKIGAAGDDPKGVYDANHVAVLNFAERDGQFKDASAYAAAVAANGAQAQPSGWIGNAAAFAGKPLVLAASPSLKLAPQAGFTYAAWIKPAAADARAVLYAQGADKNAFALGLEAGQVYVSYGGQRVAGGAVAAGIWQHVAVSVGQASATVYVNGVPAASGALDLPEAQADVTLGEGYTGDLDALQLSNVARGADWVRVAALAPAPQGKLVSVEPAAEGGESGGGVSYFRILLNNLTVDAWVVIAILLAMMAIAFAVMGFKAMLVARTERANRDFRAAFDELALDVVKIEPSPAGPQVRNALDLDETTRSDSPMCKLYDTGVRELRVRAEQDPDRFARKGISDASLEAIRSSIDTVIVRETQRLNSRMVLLTIAISGGPFLGLLGTVVGVMITFAAIAAAGDVNVNAIAPGIAAALMATVAGLGVAIPCLFGYNYLATRVKAIVADTQVFGDEYITKIAERFSA